MILNDIPSNSGLCDTKLLHNDASDFDLKYRNHSGNRSKPCGTNLTHNRSVRGLWLRGSVYQFRVRVPADLAGVVGRNHVNRSLKTDSRSLAVRLSRKVSFEVESLFETLRRDTGRAFDE
ncbi:DUF6538 domain-containing protein, partial [Novosphingobium acidiphilum]|uniref:DUF6538 domain-containing protein n=1 Tax=Novosphingobium acidiphilum TaxID=505248 RepID=UPI003CCBA38F